MATHKSAEKRNRQSKKRRERNVSIKSKVKTSVKKVLAAVEKKDAEAKNILKSTISTITKAASKGVLHKNTASRKVSRLTKKINKLG
ncbi:MAG: 30S ribosomal protein S20 [Syntrophales bacterium]|nr:30S ribosomal protein S20 [Syntrophales bacterium]MDD5233410.1 30S ribosomal protein S20 [Syntrophales bacterium]MDD5533976.1 30S ribosomal protein S20 [Syntrophales bacterium]HPL63848.1 30S ribosomal protein S20 [Syntrophales bacterium]